MTMNRIRSLSILFIIALCFTQILECKGRLPSDVKIVAEPYQWNDNMKRLEITTKERGLVFKITISNDGTESIEINKIYITVSVEPENRIWSFRKQLEINYLYLPPKETHHRFVEVDFGGGSVIDSYSAELTYGENVYDIDNPIEPYPFDFEVVSEDEFERRIKENPPPSLLPPINIDITIEFISISIGGTIGLIAVVWYLYKKRKE